MAIEVARLYAVLGADTSPAERALRGFTGFVRNTFSTALGFALGQLFVGGIQGMVAEATQAIASFERMQMTLEALVAKEIKAANGAAQFARIMQEQLGATSAQVTRYQTLRAELERVSQAIARSVQAGDTQSAYYQRLLQYQEMLREQIKKVIPGYEQLDPALQRAAFGMMNMAEALARAGPRAEELYQWVQKLAIESPYGAEDVMAAMRTALAYGFTTKEAQKLTEVMLDFAASTGASGHVMNSVALALGQIRAKGKLAGQEILQLVNAGIDVQGILARMGYTLEDVSKGLVSADEFMAAFVKTMEEDFGGAAKRQAETFTGLLNSLDDLKKLGLRAFFGSLYEAMKPLISGMVEWLQGPGLERLESWGQTLGRFASLVVSFLRADIGRLSGLFQVLGVPDWVGQGLMHLSVLLERMRKAIRGVMGQVRALDWQKLLRGLPGAERAGELVQTLMRSWQKYGPGLVQTAQATIARMREALQVAFRAVAERVGPWAQAIFGRLQAWFEEYGPVLAEAAQQVMAWLGTAFSWLARQVGPVLDVVFPVLQGLMELVLGLVAAVAQAITGDWRGAWETLVGTFATVREKVAEALINLLAWIVGWFDGDLKAWLLENAPSLIPILASPWEAFRDLLPELWAGIREMTARGWERLVNLAKEQVTAWKDAGRDIVQGLWEGLKSVWERMVAWVEEKFAWLRKLMRAEWDTSSPSRVTMRLGQDIMEGLRLGMERAFRRTDWQRYFRPASIPAPMPAVRPWPPQLQRVKQEVTLVLQGQMGLISPEDVLLALRQAQMMGLLQ